MWVYNYYYIFLLSLHCDWLNTSRYAAAKLTKNINTTVDLKGQNDAFTAQLRMFNIFTCYILKTEQLWVLSKNLRSLP